MANHRTPHNEKSTAEANGKKASDNYQGQHRKGTGMIPLGNRNRATDKKGGGHSREDS